MRNLRPEQIDSRASKASDAASLQRLRDKHKQRRSTNNPRLKSSAGKGKPGQHTNNRPVITRPSNRLIPGWLLNETTAPIPYNNRKLPHWGATSTHPITKTVRKPSPTSGTTGTSGTQNTHLKSNTPQTSEPNSPEHRYTSAAIGVARHFPPF